MEPGSLSGASPTTDLTIELFSRRFGSCRRLHEVTHAKFEAGYEGTEHMALKAVMLDHLATRFPTIRSLSSEWSRSPKTSMSRPPIFQT